MGWIIRLLRGATLTYGLVACLGVSPLAAESLADTFSPRMEPIRSEVARINRELPLLPDIPVDDLGGSEAYGHQFGASFVSDNRQVDFSIRFTWPSTAEVEFIALVPARKFTATGLDPEFGFPDDFSLSLIVPGDTAPQLIAEESATSSHPIRRGHPYIYQLDSPVEAAGIELKVSRLRPTAPEGSDIPFFALAEIFCFSGHRNLMADATVSIVSEEDKKDYIYWSPHFMIDENTPLGLPEVPVSSGETWSDIGWMSQPHATEFEEVSILIDLGEPKTVDGLRMFPARRPSLTDFPGFGVPRRYLIETSLTDNSQSYNPAFSLEEHDLANPGSNPVTTRFGPVTARFVKLRSSKLWKAFDHYPAFLALSEIQVMEGESILSDGAVVLTSELREPLGAHAGKLWSPAALTDRHGPVGELVSRKQWLQMLDRRRALEVRRHLLELELESITQSWNRNTTIALGIIGLSGLIAAIVLPFRYRRLERKRLRSIRDRIAGDLHDDVGSNLGSIQLLSEIAKDKTESREELTLINQVAAETVTSVRDIVWLLRPRDGYRASTIAHLRDTASILLESIDWTFDADIEEFALNDEDGRHLVLFFREALHNLIRHSKAEHASIRISRKDTRIQLEIRDDGRGIDPELLDRPETLRALKQRSDRLRASLDITSEIGKGTVLRLGFTPQPLDFYKAPRYPFSPKLGHS